MLSELIELTVVSGVAFLGYRIYIQGQQVSTVVDEIRDKAQEGINTIGKMKVIQPEDYNLDTSIISSRLQSCSILTTLNLSCKENIQITQTGGSDFPFFGIFLPGKAHFDFSAGYSGSVGFSTNDIRIEQNENLIQVILGTPIVTLSDLKFNNTNEKGNLNKQLAARVKAEEALDDPRLFPYYLALFFNGMENGETIKSRMLDQAFDQAKSTLLELVKSMLSSMKEGLEYDIIVSPNQSKPEPDGVEVRFGSGQNQFYTFVEIDSAKVSDLESAFKEQIGEGKITIHNINGKLTPADRTNTVILAG
ncbi:MAG: hypothetical protein ACRCXZ_00070 [Patescibacteria group bacterium]